MPARRDLDPEASPLHFFGAEVRRAREAAGMTLAELGALVPCDASTVSRIESGILSPSDRFAVACDEAFPQMGGWFTRFYRSSGQWTGPYPPWFLDWLKIEREATALRWWEPILIPGLLQTADYARALFRAWQRAGSDEQVEDLVAGRLQRQAILDRADPPELWVLLDEAALHRPVGSAKVMHGQLEHLADMTGRASVTVQVVPADLGAHGGMLGAFILADPSGTLYLETAVEAQITGRSALTERAALMFDRLRADALPRGASRDLIVKVAHERWEH
jgi:transcriptional regulator with XRE-family HTH domain